MTSYRSKVTFNNWKGLGIGDSYLEIKDSVLIFNGPDYSISTLKVDSISNDSLFCQSYDQDTGELKYLLQSEYSNSHNEISISINSQNIQFVNIANSKTLKTHSIKKLIYSIYDYNGQLFKQFELKHTGKTKVTNKKTSLIIHEVNMQKTGKIFDKISILDLDNFIRAEKNSFAISHAACYCLEIHYNQSSNILYCRQQHNNYIKEIINDIEVTIQKNLDTK